MSTKRASTKNMYLVQFFNRPPKDDEFEPAECWIAVEEGLERAINYAKDQDDRDGAYALVVKVEKIGVFAREGWKKVSP